QSFCSIQPVNAHHADRMIVPHQQRVQSPVSVAWLLPGQRDQLFSPLRTPVRSLFVTIAAAIHSHQLAGPALAHLELLAGERHVLPHAGKLQPFFWITAFRTSLSRLRSATKCFRRRFSSSSPFSFCASLTSIPP